MDERQDVQPKDKNIAQLLIKLATAQAQIKLVLAAQYMNKQRVTINTKMKEFKEYAEGQAEKYSQNAEEATEVIENYKKAVEEAMQKFGDDYLDTMAKQDEYQKMEVESIGIEKQYALELKEKRKKPEYQEWKQEVKALNREIKANANNPEKLASLAAELKDLQAKDPTYWEKQMLDFAKRDRASINEMIQFYDKELEIIQSDRDKKLNELLENKETSLAKIQKQSVWQKLVARFTSKSKSFKNNVVTPIMDKASKIKNEKIPQILKERNAKQQERKEKREETLKKMKDFKDKVGDQILGAKDATVEVTKKGIRAVVEFGREAKKASIRTIEGIGSKIVDTKDKLKDNLKSAVENSTQTLEELKSER